jgi:hypothetical protein
MPFARNQIALPLRARVAALTAVTLLVNAGSRQSAWAAKETRRSATCAHPADGGLAPPGALVTLRARVDELAGLALANRANRGRVYRDGFPRRGHTLDGQILGSPAAYGGAGVLALEPFSRWAAVAWTGRARATTGQGRG